MIVYTLSTLQDGECSITVIFDSMTADLDVAMGIASSGDAVCFGLSAQQNHDTCTASVTPGDYIFLVSSYKGASTFRVVADCGSQESITTSGASSKGVEIQEVELDANGRKLLQHLTKAESASK